MHGGSIVLESELNVGSRFTIRLPRKPPGDSQRPSEPSLTSETPPPPEVRS